MSWSPDFIFWGLVSNSEDARKIQLNSVLSIIFYTSIAVICATLEGCAIKTACGVAKMGF
jgi:hypothetical protein